MKKNVNAATCQRGILNELCPLKVNKKEVIKTKTTLYLVVRANHIS